MEKEERGGGGKETEERKTLFSNRILFSAEALSFWTSYGSKLEAKCYWNSLSRINSNFSNSWSLVRFLLMRSAAKFGHSKLEEAMLEGLCTSSNRMIRNKNAAVFLNRGKTYSANLPVVLRLKSEAHKLKVWPTAKSRHQHHQCYTKTLKINCFFYVCFFLFEMALSLLHSNTVSLTQTGVKVGL